MAKMITVYFATDTDPAKAIIDIERLEFFVSLGAMRTAIEASEKKDLPEKQCDQIESTEQPSDENDDDQIETINPDQGSGRPGSPRFHTLSIRELQTIDEINDYLSSLDIKPIDARIKRIDKAQKAAIKAVKTTLKEIENAD